MNRKFGKELTDTIYKLVLFHRTNIEWDGRRFWTKHEGCWWETEPRNWLFDGRFRNGGHYLYPTSNKDYGIWIF